MFSKKVKIISLTLNFAYYEKFFNSNDRFKSKASTLAGDFEEATLFVKKSKAASNFIFKRVGKSGRYNFYSLILQSAEKDLYVQRFVTLASKFAERRWAQE